jgi:hypothetical protein
MTQRRTAQLTHHHRYRVRQELALKQLTTELKQARKELDKNFSMRVRHIAETDTEGELKTCRRQLKWLEEENQARASHTQKTAAQKARSGSAEAQKR